MRGSSAESLGKSAHVDLVAFLESTLPDAVLLGVVAVT
jgi:hypothetical protein